MGDPAVCLFYVELRDWVSGSIMEGDQHWRDTTYRGSVPGKSIHFFATNDDLSTVLDAVEARHQISYVECGLFDDPVRPSFSSFRSLPEPLAQGSSEQFLVLFRRSACNVRAVAQRRGGLKYAVDQQANPGTVALKPGSEFDGSVLVAGSVGTIHADEGAFRLMETFAAEFKQQFNPVKGIWVGPEAKRRLDIGARLTMAVGSPKECDLTLL